MSMAILMLNKKKNKLKTRRTFFCFVFQAQRRILNVLSYALPHSTPALFFCIFFCCVWARSDKLCLVIRCNLAWVCSVRDLRLKLSTPILLFGTNEWCKSFCGFLWYLNTTAHPHSSRLELSSPSNTQPYHSIHTFRCIRCSSHLVLPIQFLSPCPPFSKAQFSPQSNTLASSSTWISKTKAYSSTVRRLMQDLQCQPPRSSIARFSLVKTSCTCILRKGSNFLP